MDADILKLLYNKITSAPSGMEAYKRHFGQLYSHTMQYYIQGRDRLNSEQKQQLASVLVEVEQSCISKLLGISQSVIKRSIEHDDYDRLKQEHQRLFGSTGQQGELAKSLDFDYGQTANGDRRLSPSELPGPAVVEVSG